MSEAHRDGDRRPGEVPSHPAKPYTPLGVALAMYDRIVAALLVPWCTWRTKLVLRLLGCRYGRRLRVDGVPVIRSTRRSTISLGDNVTIRSRFMSNLVGLTNPTVFQCFREGHIVIGDGTGCSSAVFSSRVGIQIGRNVKIGGNVRIYDHDFHAVDYLARRDPARDGAEANSAPVIIGDDVFIGANAIILKGVTVGDRSIIGAGSVVSLKQIPPDSLVAGNPARVVKSLTTITNR